MVDARFVKVRRFEFNAINCGHRGAASRHAFRRSMLGDPGACPPITCTLRHSAELVSNPLLIVGHVSWYGYKDIEFQSETAPQSEVKQVRVRDVILCEIEGPINGGFD